MLLSFKIEYARKNIINSCSLKNEKFSHLLSTYLNTFVALR